MRSKILLVIDTPGWAFDKKADNIIKYSGNKYDFTKVYNDGVQSIDYDAYSLIMVFPWNVYDRLPKPVKSHKLIAGMNSFRSWRGQQKALVANMLNAHYTAVAPISKELFDEFNGLIPNMFYTPNGVDVDAYFDMGKRDFRRDKLVFGWVGKETHEDKGYQKFVEPAINDIEGIEFKPILAHKRIEIDGLPSLTPTELNEYYNDVHVTIVSSDDRCEGGPNQVLECGATGGILLSTEIGIVKELGIAHYNYIRANNSVKSFIDCIEWIKNNRDRLSDLRTNLSHKVRMKWSWKNNIDNYIEMFDTILERNKIHGYV